MYVGCMDVCICVYVCKCVYISMYIWMDARVYAWSAVNKLPVRALFVGLFSSHSDCGGPKVTNDPF